MSTFVNLMNKQVIVSRLVTVTGNKRAYTTTTGVFAEIQPLGKNKGQIYEGINVKRFVLFTESSNDIKEADKLREVTTGNIYKVKTGGVTRRTMGSVDYLNVQIEQVN